MIQNEAYALGLYFYLLSLSEEKAVQKASIVYKKIQQLKKKNKYTTEKFVQLCIQQSQISLEDVEVFEGAHYFKHRLDISKWQSFLLKAKLDEVLPLLFFLVLKIDLVTLAKCFDVSENTVLTRCFNSLIKVNALIKEKRFNIAPQIENVPKHFQLKKIGERQMSGFFAQNLIFEYILDRLDVDSKKKFESLLSTDADLKQKYNELNVVTQFISKLSQIDISEIVTKQIQQKSNILDLIEEKLQIEEWPDSLRWVSEALGVAILITIVAVFVPWGTLFDKFYNKKELQVTLVEILKNKSDDSGLKSEGEAEDKPLYPDETKTDTQVATNKPQVSPTPAAVSKTDTTAKTTASPSPSSTIVANTKINPAASPTATVMAQTNTVPATTSQSNTTTVPMVQVEKVGYLYRGKLLATNVPVITPKIREKVIELGGRKAGEVELGWQKSQNTSYFHFTMPDTKLNELDIFLQTYGKIKIIKEKHERIMPDGIIRLIVEIEEAQTGN